MCRGRIALAIAAAIPLLVVAAMSGTAVARGWLYAFVLMSMIPIGSLALLLVHGISGGRWGRNFASVLLPAARCLPLLLLAWLPVTVIRPLIYDWGELKLPAEVTAHYLNPLFFDARTIIALAIWSILAWGRAWRSPLSAGLGLTVHLCLVTLIPADWILTLQPGAISAGFGMGFGIEQLAAALAFTAILAPQGQDAHANRDLAGMLAATLLGTVYFVYMQFVITWYGNIPDKVHWYVQRADGWSGVGFAAFAIGAAVPFLALLSPAVRGAAAALRRVGFLMLGGIALHITWLTLPGLGISALGPGILIACLLSLLAAVAAPYCRLRDRAESHGRI